jgi:Zn-dependent protease with chaperone function
MESPGLFSAAEVERASRYHRPLYLLFLLETAFTAGCWLAAWRLQPYPYGGLGWAAGAAAYAASLVAALELLLLPLSFWRGFVRERRWGFSTQTPAGWAADRAKALGVGVVLATAASLGLVAAAHALPHRWPFAAAAAAAALVLLLSFVAPLVLEPLFNRFTPLEDAALAAGLHALADRAGVPVREVLVADASRRTTKSNAYVSGLGRTRRVVLFDTLLERGGAAETGVVVAHELGHRRARHVAKGTALATVGAVAAVAAVWAAVAEPGDPRSLPLVFLVATGVQLAGLPLGAAISRRWERFADRFSLDVTGDADAFERAHVSLARTNLSDLDPPRPVYALLFSHPTPPERVALGRDWAAARAAAPEPRRDLSGFAG